MTLPRLYIVISTLIFLLISCSESPSLVNKNKAQKHEITGVDTFPNFESDTANKIQQKSSRLDSFSIESHPATFKKAEEINDSTKKPKPIQPAESQRKRLAAKMTFENETHQFGEIEQGESFIHKFKFMNTGSAPLVINKVDATCGCTQPTYPFLPLKPGETGSIEVKYNSEGKLGNQKPMITISSNAKPPIVKLYLEGTVIAPLEKASKDLDQ